MPFLLLFCLFGYLLSNARLNPKANEQHQLHSSDVNQTDNEPERLKGFMERCVSDLECDIDRTSLLRCEGNICRCPIGRIEPNLGGIVLNSEWSPTLRRCEAKLGSECNSGGGGITCVNRQECMQVSFRPSGIGCCGEGCDGQQFSLTLDICLSVFLIIAVILFLVALSLNMLNFLTIQTFFLLIQFT